MMNVCLCTLPFHVAYILKDKRYVVGDINSLNLLVYLAEHYEMFKPTISTHNNCHLALKNKLYS